MEALLARIQQPRISDTRLRWPLACSWQTGLPLTLFRHEAVAVFAGLSAMPEDDSVSVLQYNVGGSGDGQRQHKIDESLEIKPWAGEPVLLLRVAVAMRIRELESGEATHPLLSVAEATRLAVEHNLVTRYTNYLVVLEREDGDKPLDLPDVVAIKQMAPPLSAEGAMSDLSMPRFLRRQQIDEPSLSIGESKSSYLETVINHFSSDKPTSSFELALNKRLGERNTGVVPTRIAVLVRLGLDDEIAEALHQLVRDGADESEAVFALLLLLADVGQLADLSVANLNIVKQLTLRVSAQRLSELQGQLQSLLKNQLRDVVAQRT
jgi:hypothetical protein